MNLKKIYTIALSLSMAVISVITSYASEINLIPKPQKLEITEGENYTITSKTTINYSEELKDLALLLSDYIYAPTGIKLETTLSSKGGKNTIQLAIDNSIESREGYILDITSKGVTIKAKTGAGAFYGVQTLLQLLPAQIESEKLVNIDLTLPAVAISDQPQFEWRGVMLDVSRYFYSKDFVLRFIDMMSMYKMNTLHFHLVDDSGWRLEIKKYPLLTSIGAFAGEGENRTGGFYTQDDIKEMIKYGELRGVEIIPEIEFPAHMLSAVVAYPWLSCRDEQLKMPLQHYISKDLICVGQERSIEFLKDVLEETFELFPSKYVHIGGDEAVYTYWESCPHCQEIMKKEGLSRAAELQAYLTNIVAEIAEKHGRTIVGWDEILERGKVDKPVVSMIWRNINNVEHVLNSEHMAVLTPVQSAYFDMPENRLPGQIQAATWSNPISVERCYSFETAKFEGNAKILGVQASMWSDQFINGTTLQEISLLNENRSENYVEYLMLPRLLAMAEVCWTPNSERDFKDFDARLSAHYTRLGCAGFNYCIPVPEVESKKVDGGYEITISTPVEGATIHYTTSGERPTTYDVQYKEPIVVSQLSDLRAIAATSKTHHSVATYVTENYRAYAKYGTFAHKITHTLLKKGEANTITIDLTGKISGDGDYEITIVPLTDGVNVEVSDLEIFKRGESSAKSTSSNSVKDTPVTIKLSVSQWQAGTPYSAKMTINADQSHNGNIAVFIRK